MSKKNTIKLMAKNNVWLVLIAIVILVAGGLYIYQTVVPQTAVGPGGVLTPTPVTSGGCAVNPSVVVAVSDTLNPGTSVTPTSYYRLNGQYTATTAPTTVGTSEILLTNTSYLSVIKSGVPIGCGSNLVTSSLYNYANATLTYYSDNGLNSLTLNTVNETAKAAGGAYNWKVHMQGVDKKSTGKQLFVVELSANANVSSVSMTGAQSVAVPNGYARQLSNGYAAAFLLPAITGNTASDYNLAVSAATSKVITGTVYTTIYSVQPFVETDGTFSDSGLAFDSVNTAKYKDSQTKNFIIV